MSETRDAFFCHYPLWAMSKTRRYQARVIASGRCVRCREPRARAGVYCDSCREAHRLETQQQRAVKRA
jgi:hypothetical protein